jgi:hypothetical protein
LCTSCSLLNAFALDNLTLDTSTLDIHLNTDSFDTVSYFDAVYFEFALQISVQELSAQAISIVDNSTLQNSVPNISTMNTVASNVGFGVTQDTMSTSKPTSGLDSGDRLWSLPAFARKPGIAFLSNNIRDTTSLQQFERKSRCTFVSFETMGHVKAGREDIPPKSDGISQIGLARIENITHMGDFIQEGATPRSLEDFVAAHGEVADARCINVIHATSEGKKNGHRPDDPLPFGEKYSLPMADIEEHVVSLLKQWKQPAQKLILVGWGIHYRLHFLGRFMPAAVAHVDGWIDIKELSDARGDCGRHLNLRLLDLGIANGGEAKAWHYKNAGFQAARILTMLASFLGSSSTVEESAVENLPQPSVGRQAKL